MKYYGIIKIKLLGYYDALIRLQPYEIELYYKPGAQNYAADLLSREKEMMIISDNNAKQIVKQKPKTRFTRRRTNVEISMM